MSSFYDIANSTIIMPFLNYGNHWKLNFTTLILASPSTVCVNVALAYVTRNILGRVTSDAVALGVNHYI